MSTYQVTTREDGRCIICSQDTEVVTLTKEGQAVKLCRTHMGASLKAPGTNGQKEHEQPK